MRVNNVTVRTIKSKNFFSGNINLTGDKQKDLLLDTLTETQLLDIIEAESNSHLIVSDIEAVKEAYEYLTSSPKFDDSEIKRRVTTVENALDGLTIGQVSSVMFWDTTEW